MHTSLRIITALILLSSLVLASCKKKQESELPEEPCNSSSVRANDSLVTLMARYKSTTGYEIIKIQYGLSNVVASTAGYDYWWPSISPDKQKFICMRSSGIDAVDLDDYATAELWMFNMDGTNGHVITTLSAQSWSAMGMARWAPDGVHIVLAAEDTESDGEKHWNIYLTDTAGMPAVKMNTRLGYFAYPSFANGDMSVITYTAWPTDFTTTGGNRSNCEIHRASLTTAYQFSSEYQVTDDNKYDYAPTFSPDNSTIVYAQATTLSTEDPVKIWSYNYSTNTKSDIQDNNYINEFPVWCANNNKIYFVNKTSSFCIRHLERIEANGSAKQPAYRELNGNYYHFDIK